MIYLDCSGDFKFCTSMPSFSSRILLEGIKIKFKILSRMALSTGLGSDAKISSHFAQCLLNHSLISLINFSKFLAYPLFLFKTVFISSRVSVEIPLLSPSLSSCSVVFCLRPLNIILAPASVSWFFSKFNSNKVLFSIKSFSIASALLSVILFFSKDLARFLKSSSEISLALRPSSINVSLDFKKDETSASPCFPRWVLDKKRLIIFLFSLIPFRIEEMHFCSRLFLEKSSVERPMFSLMNFSISSEFVSSKLVLAMEMKPKVWFFPTAARSRRFVFSGMGFSFKKRRVRLVSFLPRESERRLIAPGLIWLLPRVSIDKLGFSLRVSII